MSHPKWEEDQIKSFVAWANFRWSTSLRERNRPDTPLLTDIHVDLKDGVKASMLLMVLFNKKINGIKKPNTMIESLQNWTLDIGEMKKQGIDFRSGSSDLVNGDIKATLAFLWALIRNNGSDLLKLPKPAPPTSVMSEETNLAFTTPPPAEPVKQTSVKEQLMNYLNAYLPSNLRINNFTDCFRDGHVLENLLLSLAQIQVQPAPDPPTLIQNCFVAGHEQLHLPFMISAADLAAGQVTEEPVITYLISMLQAISERSKVATQQAIDPDVLGTNKDEISNAPQQTQYATAVVEETAPNSQGMEVPTTTQAYNTGVIQGQADYSNMNAPPAAGNQNYVGQLVQGRILMELPEIFRIIAFADFNNFLQYWNSHQTEIFLIAEPYHINVLFTAARITPHSTALRFIEFILQRYPDSHLMVDRKGNLPMHEALEYGCRENFDYLFNLPGALRPSLPSLIHSALWPENTECLDHLLQLFTNRTEMMDSFIFEGHTPLMKFIAVPRHEPALEMLRYLLRHGSNPALVVPGGVPHAPLVVAASADKWVEVDCMMHENLFQPLPLIRLLCAFLCVVGIGQQTGAQFISRVASVLNQVDPDTQRTPLELCISLGRADLVETLLQYGADINMPTSQEWRYPIHLALLFYSKDPPKYFPVMQVLQRWGANPMVFDCRGMSAVDLARSVGYQMATFIPAV